MLAAPDPRQIAADTLHLVQQRQADGTVIASYQRRWDARGPAWVRHGAYTGFHPNGAPRTQGEYRDGREEGTWRDFHDNGNVACVGDYRLGREQGLWRFFDREGNEERMVVYRDGQQVDLAGADAAAVQAGS
jgi:hypothetical protein